MGRSKIIGFKPFKKIYNIDGTVDYVLNKEEYNKVIKRFSHSLIQPIKFENEPKLYLTSRRYSDIIDVNKKIIMEEN